MTLTVGVALAGCAATPEIGTEPGRGADAVEVGGPEGITRHPERSDGGTTPEEVETNGLDLPGRLETLDLGELGELDVRVIDRRRLELVGVREAPGWQARVDDVEHDELELVFRHDDGVESDVEVELEGGDVVASVGRSALQSESRR